MKASKILSTFFIIALCTSCELELKDNSMAEIISQQKMLDLVNNIRETGCNCGGKDMPPVKKLQWDYQLERAATSHSIDMKVKGYFSHVSQDGASFSDRINGTDYNGRPVGENIAAGYGSEEDVFNGWKNSAGHCMNMMGENATDIAVGRSANYWTMVLGAK